MKKYKVDFINRGYRRYFKAHWAEIMWSIFKCFWKGDFVLREDVDKFEANLCKFTGAKYAVSVNSGTDALKLSYKALGIKPGDEVITVSHVFIAPIEEIVHHGAKPVLIDVGEDGLMNPALIEPAITKKTVGIVPVHLSGKVCDMKEIMRIARKHKLWVVEDACQALGAKQTRKMAGTFGNTGCFSFISPKTMGGAGDNGAIITNNKELYKILQLLRNHWNVTQGALHGRQPKAPKVLGWGYNSRMDNIQAAILNVKWKYYPAMLKRRKQIGRMYNEGLYGLPIGLPIQQEGQIYQEYIIQVPDMWELKRHMDKWRVELLIRDTTPMHKAYEDFKGLSLPITEQHAVTSVRLPTYPELKDSEVKYVIKAIRNYYGG